MLSVSEMNYKKKKKNTSEKHTALVKTGNFLAFGLI